MQASGFRAFAKRVAGAPGFRTPQLRRMTGDLRPREQKLLEADPALKEFSSNKAKVELIKRFGDVLVLAVVAGATYEIYYRVMERKAAHAEESNMDEKSAVTELKLE